MLDYRKLITVKTNNRYFLLINSTDDKLEENIPFSNIICLEANVNYDAILFFYEEAISRYRVKMYEANGEELAICGNAIMSLATYLFNNLSISKLYISTISGEKIALIHNDKISINMGKPIFAASKIPLRYEKERLINEVLEFDQMQLKVTALSLGNPHVVTFMEDLNSSIVKTIGPIIENSKYFPQKTNVSFVKLINPQEIHIKIWERNFGESNSCITSACASMIVSYINGLCEKDVKVVTNECEINICYDEDSVYQVGKGEVISIKELCI